jgi:sec-independent protein translocase protein TatC
MKRKKTLTPPTTFSGHLEELRSRITITAIVLIVGLIIGWALQEPLTRAILRPLGDKLYYSNPTGGLDFIMSLSIATGVILALPVAVFHALKYIEPVAPQPVARKGVFIIFISLLLALAGASFAYFISLPSSLNFLKSFDAMNVSPLISAKEYLNFTMTYILVFALIFQLPLIISFIDRIKPLKPSKLFKKQRWVILASFIIAAFATPTPDPVNQSIMAMPLIILFNISILVVVVQHILIKSKTDKTVHLAIETIMPAPTISMPVARMNRATLYNPPNLKHITDPQLLTVKDKSSGKIRPLVKDILTPISWQQRST